MDALELIADNNRFVPLHRPWDSRLHLNGVRREDLERSGRMDAVVELLLFDMNTEYDAINLSAHFDRKAASGAEFTGEFWAFRDAWLADEQNHYVGYRTLYSLCTGMEIGALHDAVAARPVDFGPVADFLHDEFRICMVIAYDEMFTMQSCRQDFPLFESFSNPCLLDWIKLVARDEGYHYRNTLDVIRRRHTGRIREAPKVLDAIIEWDLAGREYGNTFVLDHDPSRYTGDCLVGMKEKILAHLEKNGTGA